MEKIEKSGETENKPEKAHTRNRIGPVKIF